MQGWIEDIRGPAEKTFFYQVFPSRREFDILTWSNIHAPRTSVPGQFFENFAKTVNPYRKYIQPKVNFWGMTKPSEYTKSKRSPQEIDPFEDSERTSYFIIYPFTKTAGWYLESCEDRMEMMKAHISLGRQYKDITQLLLYSFGLQDQEFIVSYETEDLARFSDLVYDLRSTQARKYTLQDTPIITGIFKNPKDLTGIFV